MAASDVSSKLSNLNLGEDNNECLEYADVVWDGCNETDSDLLEQLQYEAARLVTGAIKGTSRERLLNEVAWVKLKERRTYHKLNMIYKILNNLAPSYLQELCPVQVRSIAAYNLRTGEDYLIPHARTERFKKSFSVSSIRLWNNLPLDVRNSNSLVCFQNSYEKWRKKPKINPLFTTGNRMASLLHTRFRLGNSTNNTIYISDYILIIYVYIYTIDNIAYTIYSLTFTHSHCKKSLRKINSNI